MSIELVATLAIEPRESRLPEEFVASGSITNAGTQAATINVAALSSPSLALEIQDVHGQPVLQPPPGVPGNASQVEELGPGASRAVEFSGFLPGWSDAGRYRVRLRYVGGGSAPVVSEWAEFTLTK